MNNVNSVSRLENMALVYAITHLDEYKRGVSTMQKYYFPIRDLSEAINATDDMVDEFVEESGLSF